MLGWWINTSAIKPGQYARSNVDEHGNANFAHAETSMGRDWLKTLVEQREVGQLRADGRPNRYAVQADDVLPLLAQPVADHPGSIVRDDHLALGGDLKNEIVFVATGSPHVLLLKY